MPCVSPLLPFGPHEMCTKRAHYNPQERCAKAGKRDAKITVRSSGRYSTSWQRIKSLRCSENNVMIMLEFLLMGRPHGPAVRLHWKGSWEPKKAKPSFGWLFCFLNTSVHTYIPVNRRQMIARCIVVGFSAWRTSGRSLLHVLRASATTVCIALRIHEARRRKGGCSTKS